MGRFSKLRAPDWSPAPPASDEAPAGGPGGFRDRARLRRRLRYLRQTREIAFRDLGGFVFDARRFDRPREDIVEGKLKALRVVDRELRALETALDERREVTLLHEPGITACPGCGEIHGSDDNFCPGCGLPRGRAGMPAPRAAAPGSAPPTAE
ncbi:MAG: zinc ribbon domain-containing protein, partial [Solirubrobacteraceae bacterium]